MAMTNFTAADMRPTAPKTEKPAKALDATPERLAEVVEPSTKHGKKAKKIESEPVVVEEAPVVVEEAPVDEVVVEDEA